MNGTIGLRSKNAVVLPLPTVPQPAESVRSSVTADQIIRNAAANLGITMVYDDEVQAEPEAPQVPPSWTKGQLLNVRNRGEFYVVTLLGEEDEPPLKPAPSGALRFTNTPLCQAFVSAWYARESYDPRAR
jgi:hypothetical protein